MKRLAALALLAAVFSPVLSSGAAGAQDSRAALEDSQSPAPLAPAVSRIDGSGLGALAGPAEEIASLPPADTPELSDSAAAPPVKARAYPAQVIIIRHGEKPESGNDLSPRGYERAKALVGFFENNPAVTRYGPPAAIYAEKPRPDGSEVRPLETVQPLAEDLGLQVNTDYQKNDVSALTKAILAEPAYEGKMVLISWEHHMIPAIARALGWTEAPESWPDGVFDRAWVIDFDGGKPVSFKNIPQHLLSGDSSN